eukprot:SAG31_NODE_8645_length_1414_cov_1.825856_1_plen_134_part_00
MLRFNPDEGISIKAHCDNIMKPEYGVSYVQQFDLVLNGLDNIAARRHVNRLCLAAGCPLIESGTTGLLGQVSVHIPGTLFYADFPSLLLLFIFFCVFVLRGVSSFDLLLFYFLFALVCSPFIELLISVLFREV